MLAGRAVRRENAGQAGRAFLPDGHVVADTAALATLRPPSCNDGLGRALRGALASLSQVNREALRLLYLEGLTLEQLARTWRISRSRAARIVAASRRSVLLKTREELARRLPPNEIGGLLAAAEDAMSVTVSGVFKELVEVGTFAAEDRRRLP